MDRVSLGQRGWRWVLVVLGTIALLTACGDNNNAPPATPVIKTQPADVSVVAGSPASFSVVAIGDTPSYQWQASDDRGGSWTDIAAATSASYTQATTTLDDSGRLFRVLVSAAGATVASSSAQLTVTSAVQAPAIAVQPANQIVTEPDPATFNVTATGTSLQYQWQLSTDSGASWTDIGGATAAHYTTPPTAADASGAQFRVQISNTAGNVTSDAATLTINAAPVGNSAPVFTEQPASQTVPEGSTATFSVTVTGHPTPTLQWIRAEGSGGNVEIAGATGTSYTTPPAVYSTYADSYYVRATNSEGTVYSQMAMLNVTIGNTAPAISSQPQNAAVNEGSSAHFSVVASGSPTPTLQWQISSNSGALWSNISGANAASYDTPATVAGDSGRRFRVVASNYVGTASSDAVTLTVAPADPGAPTLAMPVSPHVVANTLYPYSATDSSGAITAYDWSWGDGTPNSSASQASHVWNIPGSFNLRLSATVNGQIKTAAQAVEVVGRPLAGGYQHVCGLKADATVLCWGYGYGVTPVAVAGLGGVVSLASGTQQDCALKTDGTVLCWAAGGTPAAVAGLVDAVALGAQWGLNCAVRAAGSVVCWGTGTLGNGETSSASPVTVSNLSEAVAISVGGGSACALGRGGSVACWGANDYGQLGDGTTTRRTTPVMVSGLTDAVAIAAGPSHSCALRIGGSVVCWGSNNTGALGDGTTDSHAVPAAVSGLTDAVAITVSATESCALRSGGTVVCWGMLGDGRTIQATPALMGGFDNAIAVGSSDSNSCALLSDGSMACWGINTYGQLGNGDSGPNAKSPSPVPVMAGAVFWR